jgi:hypothetical protein
MRAARRGPVFFSRPGWRVARGEWFRAAAPLRFLSRRTAPDSGAGSPVNGAEGGWQSVVHFAGD